MKMRNKEAVAIIRKFKDEPVLEDAKEVAYNWAIDAIINSLENGYTLCKVDDVLAKIAMYKADGDLTNSDSPICCRCSNNIYISIEKMIRDACEESGKNDKC